MSGRHYSFIAYDDNLLDKNVNKSKDQRLNIFIYTLIIIRQNQKHLLVIQIHKTWFTDMKTWESNAYQWTLCISSIWVWNVVKQNDSYNCDVNKIFFSSNTDCLIYERK